MANTGQPPPGVVQPSHTSNTPPLTKLFSSILNPDTKPPTILSILEPIMEYHHGEPSFVWEDKDVENMVINEELHYAVVGKLAYGMPDFHELKKQIPLQLELKGECSIGFLESRHVLIRLSLLEDYVHLLSRPAFYIKIGNRLHQLRGFKYEVWFDPKEETSIGVAWISFPGLPPVFFGKEALFSLARAVGRPLQLDAATKFKTRPSCAKVKVEVDLVAHRPQRFRIGIKNSTNGEIKYKWIRVRYDYIPKYCKECKLQGHDEDECYTLHPELMPKEEQDKVTNMAAKEMNVKGSSSLIEPTKEATMKVLQSGKVVGNVSKGGNAGVAAQVQGSQAKCFTKFIHPNRNPNAWSRVENKSKQGRVDANQRETVATKNAFALLKNDDEPHVVEQIQCHEHADEHHDKNKQNSKEEQSREFVILKEKDVATFNAGTGKEKEQQPSAIDVEQHPSEIHVEQQPSAIKVEPQPSAIDVEQQPSAHGNDAVIVNAEGMPNTCDAHVPKFKDAAGCFKQLIDTAANGKTAAGHQLEQCIKAAGGQAKTVEFTKNLHGDKAVKHVHALSHVHVHGLPSQESHVHVHTMPSDECVGFTKNKTHTLPSETVFQTENDTHAEEHGNMESHDIFNIHALNTYAEEHALALSNTPLAIKNDAHALTSQNVDLQLQVNAPLKSPMQVLQDLITHNVKPTDVQKAIIEQQQMEEDDDESTTGNFIQMTKEGDLSPRDRAKSGKRGKKPIQHAEPTRQITRRKTSKTK